MTRTKQPRGRPRRRAIRLEPLEDRLALSLSVPTLETPTVVSEPTPHEQELFELINRMRMDPQAELDRLFESTSPRLDAQDDRIDNILRAFSYPTRSQLLTEWQDLQAVPPLAWNTSLATAAFSHSEMMRTADTQAHTITEHDEPELQDRLVEAGYNPLIYWNDAEGKYSLAVSENIYAFGKGAHGGFTAASFTHASFAIDWGNPDAAHRENLMDSLYTEVGISMLHDDNPNTRVGQWITTVDFATPQSSTSDDGGWLVGVAFDDRNENNFYDAGEGLANVPLVVEAEDGTTHQLTTMDAGGYQIFLENGRYTVSASGEHFNRVVTKPVQIQDGNAKIDFLKQDTENIAPELDLNGTDAEGAGYHNIFFEGGDPVGLVSPEWTIVDQDDRLLHSARIYLIDRPDGRMELLDVDTTETQLTAHFDSSTGILTVEGTEPISVYRQVLSTLTYINVNNKADLSDRAIHISVFDGVDPSEEVVTTLSIEPASLPDLTIASTEMVEGDEGTMQLGFLLTLNEAPRREVTLDYELQAGTAQPGVDFQYDGPGEITFGPDQTQATVFVPVPTDYVGEEDKSFTFALTSHAKVHCEETTALGTILDDDRYTELGEVNQWSGVDVDPTRLRQLYSFEPEHDGHYTWDALYSGDADDVRLELYEGSHQGEPLAVSTFTNGDRQHLSFVADNQSVYVVKVTGTVEVEKLRMGLVARQDQEDREIALAGRSGVQDEFIIDMRDGFEIGLGDLRTVFEPLFFDRILLEGIDAEDRLTIVGSGDHEHAVLDASTPLVNLGEKEVDLGGLQRIDYFGGAGQDTLVLRGSTGNDRLHFESGTADFAGSNFHYRTFDVETVQVEGIGGNDRATFLDSFDNDLLSLNAGRASLVGNGFRLDATDFEHLIATASVEGYDRAILYGENNSLIRMGDNVSTWRSGDLYYIAEGFEQVTAMEADDSYNRVVLLGSSGNDDYNAMAGYATATNHRDSYLHKVYGFDEIILAAESIGLDRCRVPLPLDAEETWNEMDDYFLLSGPHGELRIDDTIAVDFYQRDEQKKDPIASDGQAFVTLLNEHPEESESEESSATRNRATDLVLLELYYHSEP